MCMMSAFELKWFVDCLLGICKKGKAYLYLQHCLPVACFSHLFLTCDSDGSCIVQTLTVLSSLPLSSCRKAVNSGVVASIQQPGSAHVSSAIPTLHGETFRISMS